MPTVRWCKFGSPVSFAVPLTLLDRSIGFTQQVHQGQKHAEGVLSHCVPVAFGAVEDLEPRAQRRMQHRCFQDPRSERQIKRKAGQAVKQFRVHANAYCAIRCLQRHPWARDSLQRGV